MTEEPRRLDSHKILRRDALAERLAERRAAGGRVVLTNGCFDLLHVGHVRYLEQARRLGEVLVVALNSDDSVRRLKGQGRPFMPEADRAEVLAALESVDYVTLFDEPTAEALVWVLRPDVYVKGGDYREEDLREARVVRSYGGRVELVPEVPGRSTTELAERIRKHGE